MKKIFLILLNWNQGQMTTDCLLWLKKVKVKDFVLEIVIVDNGSTDNSVEMIKKVVSGQLSVTGNQSPITIKLIENKANFGYAEGNNVGIRYALEKGADYICLLNNDTRIDPAFIVELFRFAETDKKIGILGGKIYFEKGYEFHKDRYQKEDLGKVIWYAGGNLDWNNVYGSHRGVDEVDQGQYDKPVETNFVNGCLMFVRREVFEKVGLLDQKFFMYLEDTDLSQKAKKAGFKLMYLPSARLWHLNGGSSVVGGDLQDYFITRNRLLFGFHWAPWRAKLALVKESLKLLKDGRPWQKIGVKDFYLGRLEKGSWGEK